MDAYNLTTHGNMMQMYTTMWVHQENIFDDDLDRRPDGHFTIRSDINDCVKNN